METTATPLNKDSINRRLRYICSPVRFVAARLMPDCRIGRGDLCDVLPISRGAGRYRPYPRALVRGLPARGGRAVLRLAQHGVQIGSGIVLAAREDRFSFPR